MLIRSLTRAAAVSIGAAVVAAGAIGVALPAAAAPPTALPMATPPSPVEAFAAAECSGETILDPATSGPGTFPNLLTVSGGRLDSYNAGGAVALYSSFGDGIDAYPPLCAVRYVDGVGPVSEWMFCTDILSKVCGDVGPDGQPQEDGVDVNPKTELPANPRLDSEDERIISWLIQNGLAFTGTGAYSWSGATQARSDGTVDERWALQTLIWCISDPEAGSASSEPDRMTTCADSLPEEERARILALTAPNPVVLTIEATTSPVAIGATATATLVTNVTGSPIHVTITPTASLSLCDADAPATLEAGELTVDPSGDASVEVELCVTSSAAGPIVIEATTDPVLSTQLGWQQSQDNEGIVCQVYAVYVPERRSATTASVEVAFAASPLPATGSGSSAPLLGLAAVAMLVGTFAVVGGRRRA